MIFSSESERHVRVRSLIWGEPPAMVLRAAQHALAGHEHGQTTVGFLRHNGRESG